MAAFMTLPGMKFFRLRGRSLPIFIFTAIVSTFATATDDPTRPYRYAETGSGAASDRPAAGPVLQSILVASNRRIATIDGKSLTVGDRHDGYTVMRINDEQVDLRGTKGLKTLRLFPSIDKRTTVKPQPLSISNTRKE